jgi:hypothetical protein
MLMFAGFLVNLGVENLLQSKLVLSARTGTLFFFSEWFNKTSKGK